MSEKRTYTPQQVAESNRRAAVDKASNTAKIKAKQAQREKEHKLKIAQMQLENKKAREAHAKNINEMRRASKQKESEKIKQNNANRKAAAEAHQQKVEQNNKKRRTIAKNAADKRADNVQRRRQGVRKTSYQQQVMEKQVTVPVVEKTTSPYQTAEEKQSIEKISTPPLFTSMIAGAKSAMNEDNTSTLPFLGNIGVPSQIDQKLLKSKFVKDIANYTIKLFENLLIHKIPINIDEVLTEYLKIIKKVPDAEINELANSIPSDEKEDFFQSFKEIQSIDNIAELKKHPDLQGFLKTDLGIILKNPTMQTTLIKNIEWLLEPGKTSNELIGSLQGILSTYFPTMGKEFKTFLNQVPDVHEFLNSILGTEQGDIKEVTPILQGKTVIKPIEKEKLETSALNKRILSNIRKSKISSINLQEYPQIENLYSTLQNKLSNNPEDISTKELSIFAGNFHTELSRLSDRDLSIFIKAFKGGRAFLANDKQIREGFNDMKKQEFSNSIIDVLLR